MPAAVVILNDCRRQAGVLDAHRIRGLYACGSTKRTLLSFVVAAMPQQQMKKKVTSMLPQAKTVHRH
jgi:hypothetical protein